jgi:three-Cys-motif partner protein
VTTPTQTIWPIEPHTAAKHKILRKYLDVWFPILSSFNQRIVYVDGFSGPGRYTGGEPGSPIIALEAAVTHGAKLKGEVVFFFIEEKTDRADYLKEEVAKLSFPKRFRVNVEQGKFATKLGEALDELDKERNQIAPTFALIDPFGFSGIPYALIRRLLSKEKCEVLITFMVESMNRWLEHPDEAIKSHIVEACGTREALSIAEHAADRTVALRDIYQKQLEKGAKFVRYFELRDRNDRIVYYLFFASNNPLGHLKMKEAMWKVDPLGEFTFSDSTNPNQHIMFASAPIGPLVEDLALNFHGAGPTQVAMVESHVFDKTAYVRSHMIEALRQLESAGRITVAPLKSDHTKRRASTFPNTALVTFV